MFCHSCHAANREGSLFCTTCGMRLAPPSPDQASESRARQADAPPNSDASRGLGFSPDEQGLARSGGGYLDGSSGLSNERDIVPYVRPPFGASPWSPATGSAISPYRYPGAVSLSYAGPELDTVVCAGCGIPRATRLDACPHCGRVIPNNSGTNALAPAELNSRWNWGAFAFPVLWGIAHESWLGLLAMVPFLYIPVAVILASRGNELAWQHRRFRSPEHFQQVQRIWRNAGIAWLAIFLALTVMYCWPG